MFIPLIVATSLLGQAPPPERTEYFLVETRVFADDKIQGTMTGLLRRDYRPAERKIIETSLSVGPAPGELPTVLTIDWQVDGATADLKERGGRITGRAKLTGPAWAWTAWSWTGTMDKIPGTFRSAAQTTKRGVAFQTDHLDPAGKRIETFVETQTKITKDTYDLLRGKLLPQ